MNTLSWVIYGAEILESVKVVAYIGIVLVGVLIFLMPPKNVEPFSFEHTPMTGWRGWMAPTIIICLVFIVFAPSKQTMYLIGASQAGEQIIQLQELQDLGGDAGALAKDAIGMLRQMIADQTPTPKE